MVFFDVHYSDVYVAEPFRYGDIFLGCQVQDNAEMEVEATLRDGDGEAPGSLAASAGATGDAPNHSNLGNEPPPPPPQQVDPTPPQPPAALSDGAINARLRRLMKPRGDGSYLVPEEVVRDWQNNETRDKIKALFERTAYDKDPVFCIRQWLPNSQNHHPFHRVPTCGARQFPGFF